MSPTRLIAVLRSLEPARYAYRSDCVRRIRLEWRILLALERRGVLHPLDGRQWTRAELLREALRPRHVLVVDRDASGDQDTVS